MNFPQELIDLIIDILSLHLLNIDKGQRLRDQWQGFEFQKESESQKALLSCILVSKSFSIPARRKVFHTIRLYPLKPRPTSLSPPADPAYGRILGLVELLTDIPSGADSENSMALASNFRHLDIDFGLTYRKTNLLQKEASLDRLLRLISLKAHGIERLSLSGHGHTWQKLGTNITQPLMNIAQLPSFCSLTLFASPLQIPLQFIQNPSIQCLSLRSMRPVVETSGSIFVPNPSKLNFSVSLNVKTLVVYVDKDDDVALLSQLIQYTAPALEILDLRISTQGFKFLLKAELTDLRSLIRLRILKLDINPIYSSLDESIRLINTIQSSKLEEIYAITVHRGAIINSAESEEKLLPGSNFQEKFLEHLIKDPKTFIQNNPSLNKIFFESNSLAIYRSQEKMAAHSQELSDLERKASLRLGSLAKEMSMRNSSLSIYVDVQIGVEIMVQ